jgi:protocatechuate 3,4-dioxygenase beta subunit
VIVFAALVIGGLRFRKFVPNPGVPPVVGDVMPLHGRLVDATGAPIAGATLVGSYEGRMLLRFIGTETATDARGEFRGEFRLPPFINRAPAPGDRVRLIGRLRDGAEFETGVVLTADGAVTLKLPLDVKAPGDVVGPREAARGELAGRVVDDEGKPIEGAEVDAWTFFPGNEAKTDKEGLFRLTGLDKFEADPKVEVVVRKAGYTPQFFLAQPTGRPGWVIVLRNKTYFEGRVTGPDGKPVAGARVRANCGPKLTAGEVWNEATTGEDGRYRMYAQADVYDFQVRVPGVGAARLKDTVLGFDEAKALDIRLEPALTFRAKLVDSISGKPVPGVRLRGVGTQPGIDGRSGPDGVVAIADMMPGRFDFQVETSEYGRWWSDEAVTPWNRHGIPALGWQRNFDNLDFDLTTGMQPVTITLERAATVSGWVVDPDGKPVAGATVDPALTGTGNSLTGDARFAVRTGEDGTFKLNLPASGEWEYNLVAHDGKYLEWRRWANGVLPPMRTEPGGAVRDVEIKLSRPAIVRGRVTGPDGRPVVRREVRASAADRMENRYYDPTVTTADDGSYELKFIRGGEQFIQVAPFWIDGRQAPDGTSRTVNLAPGETKGGVDFQLLDLGGAN